MSYVLYTAHLPNPNCVQAKLTAPWKAKLASSYRQTRQTLASLGSKKDEAGDSPSPHSSGASDGEQLSGVPVQDATAAAAVVSVTIASPGACVYLSDVPGSDLLH